MFIGKQSTCRSLVILLALALFIGSMTAFAQSASKTTSLTFNQSAGDSWRERAGAACRRPGVQVTRLDVGPSHRAGLQEGRVAPKRTYVSESRDPNDLALITCDPFDFVGGASKRIIVHAMFTDDGFRSHNEG